MQGTDGLVRQIHAVDDEPSAFPINDITGLIEFDQLDQPHQACYGPYPDKD
jgi:hypothetical protein